MASQTQLINLWVETTNLNNGTSEKRHITVPIATPTYSKKNVLTLLTLCLLPQFKFNSKPKVNPNIQHINPDIYIQDDVHLGIDRLWIYTRSLSASELKKAQHKCQKLLCIGSSETSELINNHDLQFNSALIEQLSSNIQKKLNWNILIDEESIAITDSEHYLSGNFIAGPKFKKLNSNQYHFDLTG